jgi:restriction system protein
MTRRPGALTELLDFSSALPWQAAVGSFIMPLGLKPSPAPETLRFAVASMSWREFERLIGHAFRQHGYTVTGFGGSSPDGGADLGLMKHGERFLVQCKHWRKATVGVTVVRELQGIVLSHRVQGGFVVTGGEFTRDAYEFAHATKIHLLDGRVLQQFIAEPS